MGCSLRTKLAAAVAAGLTVAAIAAPAAQAQTTTATFTLESAGLSISAPASKDLSSGGIDVGSPTVSASLGATTVVDNRGTLLGSWTASVELTTPFTTDDGGAHEVIPGANVLYWSGTATATDGTAVPVGAQALEANAQSLDQIRSAVTVTGVTGSATIQWTPSLKVEIPEDVVAGTYSGVITHSAA